jgi:hypothetical protein
MKQTLFRCSILAAVAAVAIPAFCQVTAPMRNVLRYQVKADRITEFEEIEKQVAASYRKAGGDHFRVVFREAVGNGQYWVISPMNKYADRDGPNPYTKVTTEQERAVRNARLMQCLEHVQSTIERSYEDLTINTPGTNGPLPLLRLTRTRVRNGKNDEYLAALKTDLIPALKKMGVKSFRVRQVLYGGNLNEFSTASGMEKWAEMDGSTNELAKAMGGDAAFKKYTDKMEQIVTARDRVMLRYLPDLSYYPTPVTTAAR